LRRACALHLMRYFYGFTTAPRWIHAGFMLGSSRLMARADRQALFSARRLA